MGCQWAVSGVREVALGTWSWVSIVAETWLRGLQLVQGSWCLSCHWEYTRTRARTRTHADGGWAGGRLLRDQGPQEEGHRQAPWRRTAAGRGSPPGCRAGRLPPQGLGAQGHPSVGCAVASWSSPTGPQHGGQNRVLATASIHRPRRD